VMGGELAHRTNPQPGGPGFSVRVISLRLWCPHTTLARQQDRSQPTPGFFRGCYSSPSSFLNRAWDRLWRSCGFNCIILKHIDRSYKCHCYELGDAPLLSELWLMEKEEMGPVSSDYFSFPCQCSFYQLLHIN
jgi:hypothetical protein